MKNELFRGQGSIFSIGAHRCLSVVSSLRVGAQPTSSHAKKTQNPWFFDIDIYFFNKVGDSVESK
jgi:hypothetical protein